MMRRHSSVAYSVRWAVECRGEPGEIEDMEWGTRIEFWNQGCRRLGGRGPKATAIFFDVGLAKLSFRRFRGGIFFSGFWLLVYSMRCY